MIDVIVELEAIITRVLTNAIEKDYISVVVYGHKLVSLIRAAVKSCFLTSISSHIINRPIKQLFYLNIAIAFKIAKYRADFRGDIMLCRILKRPGSKHDLKISGKEINGASEARIWAPRPLSNRPTSSPLSVLLRLQLPTGTPVEKYPWNIYEL